MRRHILLYVVVSTLFLVPWAEARTDAEALRDLHAEVIRAHLEGNIDMLLEDESKDYVLASRGEISRPTLAERRAFLGPYLEQTQFTEYRDIVDPVVRVSRDGTFGWVVVQVRAQGHRTGPDGTQERVEFESAWIELYEKREGRWYRTGNVSNFKE